MAHPVVVIAATRVILSVWKEPSPPENNSFGFVTPFDFPATLIKFLMSFILSSFFHPNRSQQMVPPLPEPGSAGGAQHATADPHVTAVPFPKKAEDFADTTTSGVDNFNGVKEFFAEKKVPLEKLVSLTTDGAPAMIGRHTRFIAHCKGDTEFPNFMHYHCIIHQQALCAKVIGFGHVMTPITLPAKTFDGVLRKLGFAQAEDKACYVLESLAVTEKEKKHVEEATVGQTKNALSYRKKRITASNFGLVLGAVQRSSYPPFLCRLCLACDWGILHEPKTKQLYTGSSGAVFKERGVFLSNDCLLGGSPAGTVSDDCIIEIMFPGIKKESQLLASDPGQPTSHRGHLNVWTPCDYVILSVDREQTWAVNTETLEMFCRVVFLLKILLQL
ncbi:hypothetical protein ACER0C_008139 [Sarotherodon galilaeus]